LKVKIEEVDKLIQEAAAKGLDKASKILKFVREKLVELATKFGCADIIPQKICDKIKELAAKFKVKAEQVEKYIKEIVAKGITSIHEIIRKIIDKFFPAVTVTEIVNIDVKKCEDLLSEKICTELRTIAKRLKVKIEEVDKLIQEAAAKGLDKASKILKFVREKLVELATKFGCADIIPQKICDKIKELAAKFKVKAEQVEKYIKEIVAKGITSIHEIIRKIIDKFFPAVTITEIANIDVKKCEDLLSEKICTELRAIALRLKVKAEEVDKIIQEAAAKGITKATEVIEIARKRLVELAVKFGCNDIIPQAICEKIKELAAKFKVSAEKVEHFIKEIVSKGATNIHEIIKKIIDRFFPKLTELDFIA